MCKLIIASPLVFSGGSSRISLRLSPEWDHRAGIVLARGEPSKMGECPFLSSSLFLPLCSLSDTVFLCLGSPWLTCLHQSLVMSTAFSLIDGLPSPPCVSPIHPVQPTFLTLPHLFLSSLSFSLSFILFFITSPPHSS